MCNPTKQRGILLDREEIRCYHRRIKSVEREKYRSNRTAQRARQMLRAGTMPGQERTPASCKRNPRHGAVWAPQAVRYSGSVSKVNVYGK